MSPYPQPLRATQTSPDHELALSETTDHDPGRYDFPRVPS
jgi:hypothetical protein